MNCSGAGWIASPDGSCYKLLETRATHWGCIDLCGEQNASLVCIGSAEEHAFLAGHLPSKINSAWIGNYQATSGSEPSGGWDKCASGEVATFATWGVDQPDDSNGAANCAFMRLCGAPGMAHHSFDDFCWRSYDCLCERRASASSEYLADINDATQHAEREDLHKRLHRHRVLIFAVATPLLWLLPVVVSYFRTHCRYREEEVAVPLWADAPAMGGQNERPSRRRSLSSTSHAARTLAAAEQAAKALHARVSGTVAQAGWMLLTVAFVPSALRSLGVLLLEDPVASRQLTSTLTGICGPAGLALLNLALSPVDATSIEPCAASSLSFGCAVSFHSLRILRGDTEQPQVPQ
jgi:hypothetical protein